MINAILSVVLVWPLIVCIKVVLAILGFVIVPVCFYTPKLRVPLIYRGTPGRPKTVWELAFRNPVDGLKRYFDNPPLEKQIRKGSHPGHLESAPLVKQGRWYGWHWRRYKLYSMFRIVWIYPGKKHYGEWFIGFKLGYEPEHGMDFGGPFPRIWATVGN